MVMQSLSCPHTLTSIRNTTWFRFATMLCMKGTIFESTDAAIIIISCNFGFRFGSSQ